MKKKFSVIIFSALFSFAKAQPCGLTLVQLSSYTSPCNLCNDTIVVAGIGGDGALTFSWNNGQTNDTAVGLCPGIYICTVTDTANCTSTGTFVLTSIPPPAILPVYSDASCVSCCDGFAVANVYGGTPPYSYLWSDNQVNDTAVGLCPGSYFVCVTDANGCISCQSYTINFLTGIFSPEENKFISVFPNPASDKILLPERGDIILTDLSGKIVKTISDSDFLDISDLSAGIYFLELKNKSGTKQRAKLLKN